MAVLETRRRILEAAKELHAEQGVQGTSYEEIARRAGVAQATVYRQFPTLADLIPACAHSIHVLRPVTPEAVEALFRGLRRPSQRVELLVRGTCDCYAQDADWLHAARREEDLVPALREVVQVQRNNLRTLMQAALAGTIASDQLVAVLVALVDFPFWKSLRDAGLSDVQAADTIVELVQDQLAKAGVE